MDPLAGQRWFEIRLDRVVWHLVTVGILGFILLLLLVSVSLLGEQPGVGAAPPARLATPVESERTAPVRADTSRRIEAGVETGACVRSGNGRARASTRA